ncbi:MAG TPA: hypothetical protein VMK84_18400 [Streptosporangiaceae bacterium]|nr:hypothetical protein [Streptosporangiaceae bacterium]
MAYIHIAKSKGFSPEDARRVQDKVGPAETIDGLLVQAVGGDADNLVHVTVWQSKAHKDRYEAERLLPVFQAVGLAAKVAASTEFTECDASELYVR